MQKQHNPSPHVDNWLDRAMKLKKEVWDRLDAMPETQRTLAPAPDEWSAFSVVEHLVLFEEKIVGPWRQGLLEMPTAKASIKSGLLSSMVSLVVSKTNLRVPTVSELEPKEVIEFDELRDRWDIVRERLIASLPDDIHSPWILHPALGPLSSEQIGKMAATHLEYHLRHWPTPKA